MQALNGVFEHNWSTGTTHTFTGEFGEIDLGANAEMDATIIEVAFHDNVEDAQLHARPQGPRSDRPLDLPGDARVLRQSGAA